MNTKIDPLTKERFVPRRSNQKFARPENRIKFNNNKAANFRKKVSHVFDQLTKNIRILEELLAKNDSITCTRDFLEGKGFSFNVYTHIEEIQGQRYFAIDRFIIVQPKNADRLAQWTFKRILK